MEFDVVIVGAGLVGASLARSLAGSGLAIALVEPSVPAPPEERWDTRIYALSPASKSFLESFDAWTELDASRVTPVYSMHVCGDDARSRLEFSAYEAGVDALAWIVESSRLQHAMWMQLQRQQNVRLFCPARPVAMSIREDGVVLDMEGGQSISGKLLVGADGADSWVRKSADMPAHGRSYGQQGVVANFACERPHRNAAYQWFRPDGVLAYLPLPGKLISMVWSAPEALAAELLSLPAAELSSRAALAGQHVLGDLSPLAACAAFPLQLLSVTSMVGPRIALIGDAAHVIHPLAGQGVNLGFGDARDLALMLSQRHPAGDAGDFSLLRRFERSRAEDILAMRFVTDALARLFGSNFPGIARVRNFGLNLANSLPVIRTWLVRRAAG